MKFCCGLEISFDFFSLNLIKYVRGIHLIAEPTKPYGDKNQNSYVIINVSSNARVIRNLNGNDHQCKK